jgi:ubiquinone biosynthesis protein COQ9
MKNNLTNLLTSPILLRTMVNTYLAQQKRSKTLTEKQQKFLDCLVVTNGDLKQAAELAGYSNGSHYNVVKALKNEIIDFATDVLANSAPEAAFKLVEIMKTNKPITQIQNKLQAAQAILDRVGVVKKERLDVNHNIGGGVFILPAKEVIDVTDYTNKEESE